MNVLIYVSSFYDWDPLPADVVVGDGDIRAMRVKPTVDGKWLIRVQRDVETHTQVSIPEQQIVAYIVGETIRSRAAMTRKEAAAQYISRHVMPGHAHRKWVQSVEVADDGPDPALFDSTVQRHVEAGTIDPDDVEDMQVAYEESVETEDLAKHIAAHFGVKEIES